MWGKGKDRVTLTARTSCEHTMMHKPICADFGSTSHAAPLRTVDIFYSPLFLFPSPTRHSAARHSFPFPSSTRLTGTCWQCTHFWNCAASARVRFTRDTIFKSRFNPHRGDLHILSEAAIGCKFFVPKSMSAPPEVPFPSTSHSHDW